MHSPERADRVAAWATGAGVGAVAFMITWLVGNRLASWLMGPPAGPTAALVTAALAWVGVGLALGHRLARNTRADARGAAR